MKTEVIRDLFASRAMGAVVVTALTNSEQKYTPTEVARIAYDMAEAMMCERAIRTAKRVARK